jgi:hypothetical protein
MAGAHHREPTGTVPFWAHQLAEMLLGVLLLIEGARTGMHTAVLVGMGAALLLLSLCSDGALGAWPWIGRRLHRVLDLVAAGVLAASPLLLSLDAVLPIVILEAAALGMVWLAVRTNWVARRPRRGAPPRRSEPTPPERPAVPAATAATPEPPLARKLGAAVGKAGADGPRQLGRFVGRARNAARATTTPPTAPPGDASDPSDPAQASPPPDPGSA